MQRPVLVKLLHCALAAAGMAAAGLTTAHAASIGPPPPDPRAYAATAIDTCRKAAETFSITQPVFAVGEVACVYGDINRAMADAFLQLDMTNTETVVVSSPGGSVASALDMVEHMGLDQRTLVVDGFCASSCANYLFLAARWKIVPDGSMVAWHGAPPNPRTWAPPAEMPSHAAAFAIDTMWRSEDFFYRVGISDRIAREPPEGVDIAPLTPGAFWTHSRANLEWRYGVGGILMAPETERTVTANATP